MQTTTLPRIIRRQEVLKLIGLSNTTIHNRIHEGLFPPPFSLGGNSVGWLNTEIAQMMSAIVSSLPDEKIKDLVSEITESRQSMNEGA